MAYCQYCGAEKKNADEFCSKCGKSTKGVTERTITQREVDVRYATLGERFFANFIDMILLWIVTAIISIPFGIMSLIGSQFGSPIGWLIGGPQLLAFVSWMLYFSYFESTSGQTLGKRMMTIKVVDESGGSLDGRRIVVRNILRIVDWLPFLYIIGFILLSTSNGKQRRGDIAAKTVVVKV